MSANMSCFLQGTSCIGKRPHVYMAPYQKIEGWGRTMNFSFPSWSIFHLILLYSLFFTSIMHIVVSLRHCWRASCNENNNAVYIRPLIHMLEKLILRRQGSSHLILRYKKLLSQCVNITSNVRQYREFGKFRQEFLCYDSPY